MGFFATVWDWFWLSFWIFAYIAYLFTLIYIAIDIFRSHDLSGWMKALWILLLVFLPFITGLVYLIARGQGMAERSAYRRPEVVELSDEEVRKVSFASPTEEIAKAAALRDQGIISDGEYEALKNKALGNKF
ncbi:SHOCT domain-containing protein [Agromyces salentinus]|uniref:SHOCT domain-containing protein n=1 Tax=Agromyces salentinus TaxID=269421 RepID=A0ABN2MSS5_9MICO|nr:SHOCT domain-containing protein [Agromyces salentinus]